MKEKRIIALFVSSIVAVVASLSISLGVAFALADPVAALGLSEISYNVSTYNNAKHEVVFDPIATFNETINEETYDDYVFVNSYDEILYADEALVGQIKLLKVVVNNDTNSASRFLFNINVKGTSEASNKTANYVKFAVIRVEDKTLYNVSNNITNEIDIASGKTSRFVVMAYVSDKYATSQLSLTDYMTMTVTVNQIV